MVILSVFFSYKLITSNIRLNEECHLFRIYEIKISKKNSFQFDFHTFYPPTSPAQCQT